MKFVFGFALLSLVLVVAPYFAHRLRRRRAEERPFAAAHLVTPAPPQARRRATLEDKALFATRALAVVALAFLGASPFVTCSRLSLSRTSGASVAILFVVDDSMSMRANIAAKSRFVRAREGALELLSSMRDGDAVGVVLAGAPARIALAPTTDLASARTTLEGLRESDRATDLDGAVAMAESLVDGAPQVDRRVVILSDLADGTGEAKPLGEGAPVPVWNALPEIRADGYDCAVIHADRAGLRVRARVACTPGLTPPAAMHPRMVSVMKGETILAEASLPESDASTVDVVLTLPADRAPTTAEPGALVARLSGADAVSVDDVAPVIAEASSGSVAVVVPTESETAATGGPPVLEQALRALELDLRVRPLPQIPDRPEDLEDFVGVLLDDPPGFTPEERRALGTFVDRGGAVLIALGARASTPPLGASLEPFVAHPVSWEPNASAGADPKTAASWLVDSAESLVSLDARHRVELDSRDAALFTHLLDWSDHKPLFARRTMGRGEAWVTTLPFALDESDLPLRPGFLALLEAWLGAARARTVPRRTEVGVPWTFPGARHVEVRGPDHEPVTTTGEAAGTLRTTPPLLGLYSLEVDGHAELRVAEAVVREVDLRPRRLDAGAAGRGAGPTRATLDISPYIAFALLGLVTAELLLRLRATARSVDQDAATA